MYHRDLKPRIKVQDFQKWKPDTTYDKDPELELIKRENEEYRGRVKDELLEDLYDIILKHKKEIRKIPQCSTINGASNWAAKRGLRAAETNIDNSPDNTKEIVVFDKKGKPFVVNGYTLRPSDFPVRNKYWETHSKESDRIKEPMNDWLRKKGGIYNYEEDGMFGKKNIKLTALGKEISKWDGYRMPTAPKQLASPYSAFSKLIAPMIKSSFWHKWMILKMQIDNAGEIVRDVQGNPIIEKDGLPQMKVKDVLYYPAIWNKIVSPITIYRYLYLKLIVQKDFFMSKHNAKGNLTYAEYKSRMKRQANKDLFTKWFYTSCLNAEKNGFKTNAVNKGLIDQNLINGDVEESFDDPNDGLIVLLGGKDNFKDQTTVAYYLEDGTPNSFDDIVRNENCAEEFYNILNNKDDPQYKHAKYALAIFKERAQAFAKTEIFSNEGLTRMMDSEKAYQTFIRSMNSSKGMTPNLTEADGISIHKASGGSMGSPAKKMTEVPPTEEPEAENEEHTEED